MLCPTLGSSLHITGLWLQPKFFVKTVLFFCRISDCCDCCIIIITAGKHYFAVAYLTAIDSASWTLHMPNHWLTALIRLLYCTFAAVQFLCPPPPPPPPLTQVSMSQ